MTTTSAQTGLMGIAPTPMGRDGYGLAAVGTF